MPSTPPFLVMRDIEKRFQGVKALSSASLEVDPGEIMALVGQNGAGKSTLIKVLTGAYTRNSGSISLGGQPIDFASPRRPSAAGSAPFTRKSTSSRSARWPKTYSSGANAVVTGCSTGDE